jgi:hypothetical protein
MQTQGQFQRDASLHLETFCPAPGKSVQVNPLDISVSGPFSSHQSRLVFRISWPAMPNLTSPADNVTVTLQDSADGLTFANAAQGGSQNSPTISIVIPGVAGNGVTAGWSDLPLLPGLRGPIGILVSATAGAGDNSAALISADIYA